MRTYVVNLDEPATAARVTQFICNHRDGAAFVRDATKVVFNQEAFDLLADQTPDADIHLSFFGDLDAPNFSASLHVTGWSVRTVYRDR
jgi:hypothetical protein